MSDKKSPQMKNWREIPHGGAIMEAGCSEVNDTGSWRTYCPVTDLAACIHCMICWSICPDSAIMVKDGKKVGTDLDHCKGCGVCAKECPTGAITMVPEGDYADDCGIR